MDAGRLLMTGRGHASPSGAASQRQALCICAWGRDLYLISLSLGSLQVKDDSPSESRYPGVEHLPDVAASLTVWSSEAEASLHSQIAF